MNFLDINRHKKCFNPLEILGGHFLWLSKKVTSSERNKDIYKLFGIGFQKNDDTRLIMYNVTLHLEKPYEGFN